MNVRSMHWLSRMTRILRTWALAMAFASSPAAAQPITYRVSGQFNKDAISDRIYNAASDSVRFQITLEADVSAALAVPAGTPTNLPNFPAVTFAENGFHLPRAAVRSISFQLSSGAANFTLADLVGDPASPGLIFVTGSLEKPTAVHILLASSRDGYLEIGLPECTQRCMLKDGIVLDKAGPFGRISRVEIHSILRTSR